MLENMTQCLDCDKGNRIGSPTKSGIFKCTLRKRVKENAKMQYLRKLVYFVHASEQKGRKISLENVTIGQAHITLGD